MIEQLFFLKKFIKIKHVFVLFLFVSLMTQMFQSCGPLRELSYDGGQFCDGKNILAFTDFNDLQNEHKALYQRHLAGAEEDSVLVNFENEKFHYSLRKKDNAIDDGTAPDEPDFDPFNYTTDGILETILNQDGMVIIDNEIYMWDDGCVLLKTINTCVNYNALLTYRDLYKQYQLNPTDNNLHLINVHQIDYKIQEVNSCSDLKYDFETISETNFPIDEVKPTYATSNRSSGCGYDVFITEDFISNDPVAKKIRYRLTANNITIPGTTPLYYFYFDDINAAGQLKIITGSLPNIADGTDWFSISPGAKGIVYPGKWLEIEVDYSVLELLDIRLTSTVGLTFSNSCTSTDVKVLDLVCPISISKRPLNAQNGEWQFEIEGIQIDPGVTVQWTFGDGKSQIVTGQQGAVHAYVVPCEGMDYDVTASIENTSICKNPISVGNVLVGDPCKFKSRRTTWKARGSNKIAGKRVLLVAKIKTAWEIPSTPITPTVHLTRNTKVKNKFRWRVDGTKTINMTGNLYMSQGNNCVQVDVNTIYNPIPGNPLSRTGKKKLKQKRKDGNLYLFDANTPYQVEFSHSNPNFTPITLQHNVPCAN